MIDDEAAALAFVKEHGVVALVRAGALPSFVEAVAGGPVRGSWWGHARGKVMYALAEGLEASGDVRSLKLVDGKVCFVHRDLWPALLRVITDARFRKARRDALSKEARALATRVEKAGSMRAPDGTTATATKAVKAELERSLLVHVGQEHTETGAHATVLSSWKRVLAVDSADLPLEAARAALAARGVVIDPA